MAGPRFSASQRPAPARPARVFTLDQANRALPLVGRIVADVVRTYESLSQWHLQVEKAAGRDLAQAEQEVRRAQERMDDLLSELSDIGVDMKDYRVGLVDFVARHEGRDIFLCWKLGEAQITHWHELQAGFAGRKPVALLGEP
jgi:hypothetical protein